MMSIDGTLPCQVLSTQPFRRTVSMKKGFTLIELLVVIAMM